MKVIIAITVFSSSLTHSQGSQLRVVMPAVVDSSVPMGSITSVHLAQEGVLVVNDARKRRVIAVDSSLKVLALVLDTMIGTERYYGAEASRVVGTLEDSVIFLDRRTGALLITPIGFGSPRVVSIPSSALLKALVNSASVLSAGQHVIVRAEPVQSVNRTANADGSVVQTLSFSDSSALLQFSLKSRAVDTIGWLHQVPRMTTQLTRRSNGEQLMRATINPLAWFDEFVVGSTGQPVIIRGARFSLVLANRDTVTLPFDSRPLSLADRQQIADSVTKAWREFVLEKFETSGRQAINEVRDALIKFALGDDFAATSARSIPRDQPVNDAQVVVESIVAELMPLSYPPLQRYGAILDRHANLWLLPATSKAAKDGVLAYDVFRANGALSLRVQFPSRCALMAVDSQDRAVLRCSVGSEWSLMRTASIRLD